MAWRGGSTGSNQSAALVTGVTNSAITESIPLYDFGSVSMLKGNVEHGFAIKNTTNGDITIQSAETSCMCTRAVLVLPDGKEMGPFGMPGHGFTPPVNVTVRPGETITIAFLFSLGAVRAKIMKIGGAYIAGIFVVYLLIGLGIL